MKKVVVMGISILMLIFISGCTTNTYTVSFNTNGGNTIDSIELEELTNVSEPIIPMKEAHTFYR
jgi:hypothetical protein